MFWIKCGLFAYLLYKYIDYVWYNYIKQAEYIHEYLPELQMSNALEVLLGIVLNKKKSFVIVSNNK